MLDYSHEQYSQINTAPPPSLFSLDPLTPNPYMAGPPQNHNCFYQDANAVTRTTLPPQNEYDQPNYNTSAAAVYNSSPYPIYSAGPSSAGAYGRVLHPPPQQQQPPLQQPAPPSKQLNQAQIQSVPLTSQSLLLSSTDSQFAYNRNGLIAYTVGSPNAPPVDMDQQVAVTSQSPITFAPGVQNSPVDPPFPQQFSGYPGQFPTTSNFSSTPGVTVYNQPFKIEEFGYEAPLFEENHFPRHQLDLLTSFDYFSTSQKQMNLPVMSEPLSASGNSLNTLRHLYKHQKKHHNMYEVSIMDHLKSKPELWAQVTSQASENSYKCAHCSNEFHSLLAFVEHLDEIKVRRTHLCPVDTCPFSIIGLQRKAELRRHCILEHFKRGRIKENSDTISPESELQMARLLYLCHEQHCGKHFYRKDSLQRHQKLVHHNKDSKFNRKWNKLRRESDNHLR